MNFLIILLIILERLISVYALIMLIYCVTTWVIRDPYNKFLRILAFIAEPPLKPISNFLGRFSFFRNSPIDFAPLILFFILRFAVSFIALLINNMAFRLI